MSWLEKLLPPKISHTDPTERRSVPEGLWIKCPSFREMNKRFLTTCRNKFATPLLLVMVKQKVAYSSVSSSNVMAK